MTWNKKTIGQIVKGETFAPNGCPESKEAAAYYARFMAYVAECETLVTDPADPNGRKVFKCSPICPLITVNGKSRCLLNKDQCRVRRNGAADCDVRHPYIHYDEAKRVADLWIDAP